MADPEFKTKLRSLSFGRPSVRATPKQTVDHTDTAIVTTTEHWDDRNDVTVAMREALETKVCPSE